MSVIKESVGRLKESLVRRDRAPAWHDIAFLVSDHDRLEAEVAELEESVQHWREICAKKERENAELARKARCFDAMVEHNWLTAESIPKGNGYGTWNDNSDCVGEGATAVESVEAAVKALEGK